MLKPTVESFRKMTRIAEGGDMPNIYACTEARG